MEQHSSQAKIEQENYSQKLDQNYNVASWEDSRTLCDLAGESDVCNTTSDLCNIKLSSKDVSHIFSYPLWINGFVTRPPWIYKLGCTEVLNYILPSHRTGVFKLNTNQTINDCVTLCGNSSSYGLSEGLLCHCLSDLSRTKSNLSNCYKPCHTGSTKHCKQNTNNDGIIYITEYKQYTGHLMKNVSNSPWYSCAATNTSLNLVQTEDCRKTLPFMCVNQSELEINNNLVTWYAANKHCRNLGMILVNKIPLSNDIMSLIPSDIYFWTGVHKPLKWIWDSKEDVPNHDVIDCLVLNTDEHGLELQTRNCSFDGLSGLCIDVQSGNTTFNFSQIYTTSRGNRGDVNVQSNSMPVYIGVGIGVLVLCSALSVGAVFARKRFIKGKKSHLLSVNNGTKIETDIETDDSIHLRNESYSVKKEIDTGEYKSRVPQENLESLSDKKDQIPSVSGTSNTKHMDLAIETIPDNHKNKKSSKSTSKKKKAREIEISIEDESVTIVDDGSYETQLSQTV